MKKFYLPVLLALISSIGCTKSVAVAPPADASVVVVAPPPAPPPVPPPVVADSLVIKGDGWEFTLPESGWETESPEGSPNQTASNEAKKNMIMLTSMTSNLNSQGIALMLIRGFKESGAKILSTTEVVQNATTYTLVVSQAPKGADDAIQAWTWITTKNGKGYAFTCGGIKSAADQAATCATVFKTLKIN
jgi:hypothetical protein